MIFLAYLDPGSGSYLFQMLIAGILAGLYTMKSTWARLKNFFFRNRKKPHKR